PIGPVALRRGAGEPVEEALLDLWLGETVRAPHHHGRRAHHAVGHPALVVLEVPSRHALGQAQRAVSPWRSQPGHPPRPRAPGKSLDWLPARRYTGHPACTRDI